MQQQSAPAPMAIVSIDLCGYGLLMDRDEAGTHRAMMTCLREILEPTVTRWQGRVVKSTGDGALIAFSDARQAVHGMIDFQQRIAAWNDLNEDERRLDFRVGIHVATAIVDAGELYGQGVNLAVRLQEVAAPRSILISKAVVDELDDTSRRLFADSGKHRLKNIQRPVALYRWREGETRTPAIAGRCLAAALIALILILLPLKRPDEDQAATSRLLSRSESINDDRTKIAVLPFAYPKMVSGVSDLLTELPERIKADLAKNRSLAVLSSIEDRRTFEQGGYVLEGAIEDDHDGVRVSVQLKDGQAGNSLWAEEFDSASIDAASLSDRVASGVASSVAMTMRYSERIVQTRSENAYNAYLRAIAHYDRYTPDGLRLAVLDLQEALIWDPDYSRAHALLAAIYLTSWQNRWRLEPGKPAKTTIVSAENHLAKALEPTGLAHAVVAEMLIRGGRHADAIAAAERSIVLEPDEPFGYYAKGLALTYFGRPDEALPYIRTAIQLNPHGQRYLFGLALAEYGMERFNEALKTLKWATARNPDDDWPFLLLAATYGQLRWADGAKTAVEQFDELSLQRRSWSSLHLPYVLSWPFRYERDRRRLHDGMMLAGISPQFRVAVRQ